MFEEYIGKTVRVKIDRPMGSPHPTWGWKYPINYGYIPETEAPDGKEIDAYVLEVEKPVKEFRGKVIAVVHRLEDEEDKLVVVPEGVRLSDKEIKKQVHFQERWFKSKVVR